MTMDTQRISVANLDLSPVLPCQSLSSRNQCWKSNYLSCLGENKKHETLPYRLCPGPGYFLLRFLADEKCSEDFARMADIRSQMQLSFRLQLEYLSWNNSIHLWMRYRLGFPSVQDIKYPLPNLVTPLPQNLSLVLELSCWARPMMPTMPLTFMSISSSLFPSSQSCCGISGAQKEEDDLGVIRLESLGNCLLLLIQRRFGHENTRKSTSVVYFWCDSV